MVSNLVNSTIFLRYNFTTAQVVYGQLIMSQRLPAAHTDKRHNTFLMAVPRMGDNCTLQMNSGTPSLSKQEHQSR